MTVTTEERPVLLDVRGLSRNFGGRPTADGLEGGLWAVRDFDLQVREGQLAGLIGPNGAGKTTVFNMVSGLLSVTSGSVQLDGREVVGVAPHDITQLGIGRTFQNIRLFPRLSVLDNVRVAYHPHAGYGFVQAVVRGGAFYEKEAEITEKAQDLLALFDLQDRQDELASNLPYGEQRRLEIARALASAPRLLLLDEPAAGMNPREVHSLMEMIAFIRERFHLTILLIEHQMRVVMGICEWITVMDFGQVICRGDADLVCNDPLVIEAYLGKLGRRT